MKLYFISLITLFLAVSCTQIKSTEEEQEVKAAETSNKPNIIYILADDLGYGDVGFNGQEMIPTPHIDQLAGAGMQLTRFYAGAPVCAPSRCTLMTGKHTGHSSVRGNQWQPEIGVAPLADDDITIAEALQNSGYITGITGRWHLGGMKSDQKPFDNGFDYHFGKLSALHRNKYGVFIDDLWDENGQHIPEGKYAGLGIEPMFEQGEYYHLEEKYKNNRPVNMDEMVTDKAIEFIEQNSDSSFFLYVAYSLVHGPIEMHEQMAMDKAQWPEEEQAFASMVRKLDQLVGRIVTAVDKQGIAENTIIIFTSDNGPHMEGHDADFFNSNDGFKGYKRDLYEGGIRMPTIVRWKGNVQPGTSSNQLLAFWDVLPTVCDAAGVSVPQGIDGISFMPLLRGEEQPKHDYLYWESLEKSHMGIDKGRKQAVTKDDWKLIRFLGANRIELYNLKEDPAEENNLAEAHPDKVRALTQLLNEAHTPSARFPLLDIELAN